METPTFIESYQTEEYDFCDRVIERLEKYLESQDDPNVALHFMNGTKTNGGEHNRKDYSINFTAMNDPLSVEMHEILRRYVPLYAQKHSGFGMQGCMSEVMKVQKTPPKGGFHTWHCEHGRGNSSSWRNLTWTLYLNDVPEGEGNTEFIEYGIKVQPKKGLLCFFPAAWTHTHRGNPVYSCDKYITTGWYYLV
jgi:hypothetical protein